MPSATTTDGPAFVDGLIERALAAGADDAQAAHVGSDQFEINFETKDVTLLRSTVNDGASLTVFTEGKKGSASFNGTAEEDIETAVRAALEAAEAGVPDEANQVADVPSESPSSHGSTEADRDAMLDAVMAYLGEMRERYPQIRSDTSIYAFSTKVRSFRNSKGVRQQEGRGSYHFGAMFGGKDGEKTTSFNYTGVASFDPLADLLEAGTVRRLLDEILQSFDPRPVPEKFVGDIIVTPDCMSDLVGTLAGAIGGYNLMAETTPYKDKRGAAIASPCFSLLNRPQSPEFPGGTDYDGFGVPTRDLDVVTDGVLNDFLIDFYISKKLDMPQTAGATNFVVPAGTKRIADIIRETKRGIVLSRFSGGAPNNNLDFSGVAKNSFYVEDGEVRYALIETMIAGNFQELFLNIRDLSSESVNFGGSCYPYLAASGVTISGE